MSNFIKQTVQDIFERYKNLGSLIFVLPNHRSISVLREIFQENLAGSSTWFPRIYTVRELMQQISGLSLIDKFPLWLDFYTVLYQQSGDCVETFDKFVQWAPQALADFDELDLHLIDTKRFFSYISSEERISQWGPRDSSRDTLFVKKHFLFLEKLGHCYNQLRDLLLKKGKAYHGLIFRSALDRLDDFLEENLDLEKIFFIAMNALSRSETALIQRLFERGRAETYWDVDAYYYEDETQEAGAFVRSYFERWSALRDQPVRWVAEDFKKCKQIEVIGTSGQIGQVKSVGSLLSYLAQQGEDFSRSIVVLADEGLLIPLLHAIPKEVDRLDVEVPYPLQDLPLGHTFLMIFHLFANRQKLGRDGFYHKDLLQLFADVNFKRLFRETDRLSTSFIQKNLSFISDDLIKNSVRDEVLLEMLHVSHANPKVFLGMIGGLSQRFKDMFSEGERQNNSVSALSFLTHFNRWLGGLSLLLDKQPDCIVGIKALVLLYEQWLRSEKIRLFEKKNGGMLLTGFLDTRLLDFDMVIMISVNEGVLPPEKPLGSWIPFNIRKRFGLPTYREQDALYAYHFYNLLQRAQKAFLIYNTESDGYGSGEKSRFIHQIEIESPHQVIHKVFSSKSDGGEILPIVVEKSPSVMRRLEQIALKGFSPSAISLYIRNPIGFYQQRVLNLKDREIVEEHIEACHMGMIVHQVLEELYSPVQGQHLTLEVLREMKGLCESTVELFFQKAGVNYRQGKNLLIYRVVKKYIEKLITWDEKAVEQGSRITIQAIEFALSTPLEGLAHQVRLYGLIDRVDICDGLLRIIDYKIGAIENKELKITSDNFDKFLQDPAHGKELQLLIYATLWLSSYQKEKEVYPGIFSFRKMRKGWVSFSVDGDQAITSEVMKKFLPLLSKKISELLDPDIPFVERGEKVKTF
ncbi:MAG: PD-(D/E)XK nuclease family protein [Flavobacteriales bacterium Tduv]